MSPVVETNALTKHYRDKVAVSQLNLKIDAGEIFGFLGPNGAGKTTTILMLLGLSEPTSGSAAVCGFDPTRHPLEVKKRVGYLPENPGFYDDLTGRENLLYIARLNRVARDEADRRITRLLEQVGLANDGDRLVREYSRGMKQRLGIAEVLVKDPQVVVMDEPTLGIDPDGVTRILELITGLSRDRGMTVMISSHLLHQVQQICHRIGIIVKGKMIAQGDIRKLGSAIINERQWSFLLEVSGNTDGFEKELRSIPGVAAVEPQARGWLVRCTQDVRPSLVAAVSRRGLSLLQLRSEDPTLEEIYLKYFREA